MHCYTFVWNAKLNLHGHFSYIQLSVNSTPDQDQSTRQQVKKSRYESKTKAKEKGKTKNSAHAAQTVVDLVTGDLSKAKEHTDPDDHSMFMMLKSRIPSSNEISQLGIVLALEQQSDIDHWEFLFTSRFSGHSSDFMRRLKCNIVNDNVQPGEETYDALQAILKFGDIFKLARTSNNLDIRTCANDFLLKGRYQLRAVWLKCICQTKFLGDADKDTLKATYMSIMEQMQKEVSYEELESYVQAQVEMRAEYIIGDDANMYKIVFNEEMALDRKKPAKPSGLACDNVADSIYPFRNLHKWHKNPPQPKNKQKAKSKTVSKIRKKNEDIDLFQLCEHNSVKEARIYVGLQFVSYKNAGFNICVTMNRGELRRLQEYLMAEYNCGVEKASKKFPLDRPEERRAIAFQGHPGEHASHVFPCCLYDCHQTGDYSYARPALTDREVRLFHLKTEFV